MGPVSTRRFFKCPHRTLHLITIRTLSLPSLPTTPRRAEFKRDRPGAQRAGAQLLTRRLCWRGLALSDSSWSQLIRTHRAPHRFLSPRPRVCVCVRTRECCVLVYLRVHPCLQQLSEIIRLYHVMPHVGIFPAVPERLFCFLRLASARRNAAY